MPSEKRRRVRQVSWLTGLCFVRLPDQMVSGMKGIAFR
ncbi:hypothetical protein TRICHSKD4_4315 [Roseibium sp. TrichSKD4]|nr:hypothetical protein TRICHSKD4_4315 [Roseibium sp. TrichSKD4]